MWFNEGKTFAPIGLGDRDTLQKNEDLRQQIGDTAHSHLVAYVKAGNQIRNELPLMLADCPSIIFVDSFEDLKATVAYVIGSIQNQ